MCGICGIVSNNALTESLVKKMANALHHRGPDSKGTVHLSGCHLGQARLSIIDIESGCQPMTFNDGKYWITFNGEIYNYKEIKSTLLKYGYNFKTLSDTEVIMAAFSKWGKNCLSHFRGMFAFAIWNTQENELFVARDCFGEKPFYYAITHNNEFLFASEIKSILAAGLIHPLLDLESVDAYLALGYVPPDCTIYSNIKPLPPGSFLEWKEGKILIQRYWTPSVQTQQISISDASEQLDFLLKQAVNRQMIADVPIGAFLSGGLDSSTIVALMQMQSAAPVKTFSVGFGDSINELPYARAVSKKYGTEHHELNLGIENVADLLLKMVEIYDEPFADTSNIPTYMVSSLAANHVKVVLTGDGADELFGGYAWSYPMLVRSEKIRGSYIKWFLSRTISKLLRERNRPLSLYSSAIGLSTRWSDIYTRQFMQNVHIKSGRRRQLFGENNWKILKQYYPSSILQPDFSLTGVNRGFYFDLQSYLPGDILVKVDRAAMANSLETRAPFLDKDLAEFALSLPVNLKVNNWDTKIILKDSCSKYWPDELQGRKKQGFGSPISVWMKDEKVKAIMSNVFAPSSELSTLLPGIRAGGMKTDYEKWILLTLGLWLEKRHM